jgi:serine/threonine protein kinase
MPYIAMEFVNGTTLREFLGQGPLPYEKLLRYGSQIAEGLAKAHHAGIVHRDLKPENLMISVDDHAKILDFGLAKLIDDSGGFDPHDATATREHGTADRRPDRRLLAGRRAARDGDGDEAVPGSDASGDLRPDPQPSGAECLFTELGPARQPRPRHPEGAGKRP